jgi:hypothetical protein
MSTATNTYRFLRKVPGISVEQALLNLTSEVRDGTITNPPLSAVLQVTSIDKHRLILQYQYLQFLLLDPTVIVSIVCLFVRHATYSSISFLQQ